MFYDMEGKSILNGQYTILKIENKITTLLSIETYVNNVISGPAKYFDKSGILTSICYYENGFITNKKENINSVNYVDFVTEQINGKYLNGQYIIKNIDDHEIKICKYINNLLNDKVYTFVPDEKNKKNILVSIENYLDGRLYGEQNYYNALGKIVLIETYEKNSNFAKQSTWFEYYDDRVTLHYIINYKKNKKDGVTSYYYPDGKLKEQRTYRNGILDGPLTKYDETGKATIENYEFGSKIV